MAVKAHPTGVAEPGRVPNRVPARTVRRPVAMVADPGHAFTVVGRRRPIAVVEDPGRDFVVLGTLRRRSGDAALAERLQREDANAADTKREITALEALRQRMETDWQAEIIDDVRHMREDFAAGTERDDWRGAWYLRDISAERMAALQRVWRAQAHNGGDLYSDLLGLSEERRSDGLTNAIQLLRQGFLAHPELAREFGGVFGSDTAVARLARELRACFGTVQVETFVGKAAVRRTETHRSGRDREGLILLRGQSPDMLKRIDAAFAAQFGTDIASWLIREAERSPAMLRAIAILRFGIDAGDHVELAAMLIPPGNHDETLPVRILRALPTHARREKVSDAFHETFRGVGPRPGESSPSTLWQYLQKLDGLWKHRPYREALALLHHEPTLAEELYFALSRWISTENEAALAVMKKCVVSGISRRQLDLDWKRFVQGGLEGHTASFADAPLGQYIADRFALVPTETATHLLALYDALDADDAPAMPPPEQRPGPTEEALLQSRVVAAWQREDRLHERDENRLIRAAEAEIHATEGVLSPNDAVIHDAVRDIRDAWTARLTRLRARVEAVGNDGALDLDTGREVRARYQRVLDLASEQWSAAASVLKSRLRAGDLLIDTSGIRMDAEDAQHAALLLRPGASAADDAWYLARHHQWQKLVALVTKTWATGRMDVFLADAARPVPDERGAVARPAFALGAMMWTVRGTLPYQRVLHLVAPGISDVQRGVGRLELELQQVTADPDLAEVLALLDQALDLREAVVTDYARRLAGTGEVAVGHASTPASVFLTHVRGILERRMRAMPATGAPGIIEMAQDASQREASPEGVNFLKLSRLLEPPRNTAERAAYAQRRQEVGRKGALSGVATAVADAWDYLSGNHLGEARDRSGERIGFLATATEAQLAPLYALTGAKTREELSAIELGKFEVLQDERQAVENTCAQLIAGLVETLVEAGLAPLTGGAGFAAVINAVAAGVASVAASKAMLGPSYRAISWENFNAVMQSGLGTAMIELGLRNKVLQYVPLDWDKRGGRAAKFAQDVVHNEITGIIEGSVLAGAETSLNILARDKWPSDDDIAKQAEVMLSRMIAKATSTHLTVDYNPQKVHAYLPIARHLKNNIIFKLALKVTEAGGKEIVAVLTGGMQNQTFAERFVQVLWKEARGVASTGLKTASSALATRSTFPRERGLIEEYRQRDPPAFRASLNRILLDQFEEPEKGAALRAAYEEQKRTQAGLTPGQFMLRRLQGEDKPGQTAISALQGKIHKGLLAHAELYVQDAVSQGVLGERPAGPMIGKIARDAEPRQAPRRLPERYAGVTGLAADMRRLRGALDLPAATIAVAGLSLPAKIRLLPAEQRAHFGAFGSMQALDEHVAPYWLAAARRDPDSVAGMSSYRAARRRLHEIADRHADATPAQFAARSRMLAEVMNPESEYRRLLASGDAGALEEYRRQFGDWKQNIGLLMAGDQATRRIAYNLMFARGALAGDLRHRFGAVVDPGMSTKPTSDVDPAMLGADSGRRMLAGERHLVEREGENWSAANHMHIYMDGRAMTRYTRSIAPLPASQRGAIQAGITRETERYSFAQMLHATSGASPAGRRFVEQAAAAMGLDLAAPRSAARELRTPNVARRIPELVAEIDAAARESEKPVADTPAARAQRAHHDVELAKKSIELNAMMVEAHVGPGANQDILERIKVRGPAAYQAVLSYLPMYVEHRVAPGGDKDTDPSKYIVRMVDVMKGTGITSPELESFATVAHAINQNRELAVRGNAATQGLPFLARRDLTAFYDAFQAALLPAMRDLRRQAFEHPETLSEEAKTPADRRRVDRGDAERQLADLAERAKRAPADRALAARARILEHVVAQLRANEQAMAGGR